MEMEKEDSAMMEKEDEKMEEGSESEDSEENGEEEEGEESDESDWKAQCDANDLLRAAEIKADPARMKAALEILGQKKKAIESMEDLMAVRKSKMLEKA